MHPADHEKVQHWKGKCNHYNEELEKRKAKWYYVGEHADDLALLDNLTYDFNLAVREIERTIQRGNGVFP